MSQVTLRRTISHLGPLQIAIILLAVVTALVHLDRGFMTSFLAGHFAGPPQGHFSGPPHHFTGPRPGHFGGPPPGTSVLSLIPVPLSVLFYLNFVGYITLVTALYLPLLRRFQPVIRWVLIGYTAITILAWYLITGAQPNLLAYIDKPIEVTLIILLLIEAWQVHRVSRG